MSSNTSATAHPAGRDASTYRVVIKHFKAASPNDKLLEEQLHLLKIGAMRGNCLDTEAYMKQRGWRTLNDVHYKKRTDISPEQRVLMESIKAQWPPLDTITVQNAKEEDAQRLEDKSFISDAEFQNLHMRVNCVLAEMEAVFNDERLCQAAKSALQKDLDVRYAPLLAEMDEITAAIKRRQEERERKKLALGGQAEAEVEVQEAQEAQEAQSEAQSEAQAEAQAETQAEAQPEEAQAEAQAEPQVEAQTEFQPEIQPETQPEAQPEPQKKAQKPAKLGQPRAPWKAGPWHNTAS